MAHAGPTARVGHGGCSPIGRDARGVTRQVTQDRNPEPTPEPSAPGSAHRRRPASTADATGASIVAWERERPRRFRPAPFPAEVSARLRAALAWSHADRPFGPADVRDAASRVRTVAERLGLEAVVVRGGLDVGGAELDHVWVAVDGRVVDVALPVISSSFTAVLRAYVAGEVATGELDRVAHGYALTWRVVGEFPDGDLRYVGRPVWHDRHPA